jgi:hypothetical protein
MQHEITVLFSPHDKDLAAKFMAMIEMLTDDELTLCEKVVFAFIDPGLAAQTIQLTGRDGIVVFSPHIRKCASINRAIAHELGHVLSVHHIGDQRSHGNGSGPYNQNAEWEAAADRKANEIITRLLNHSAVMNREANAI